eukprot:TRINITY_DN841_c0_g1_i1.p1 TRINITY_DN841_c0_g1~~TRINITY_DN841_c0_g1_i1.p1  ORF type:complete len:188 (+),score=57.98 TRINITY_DN841_c0_g1_i1:285-848(+)
MSSYRVVLIGEGGVGKSCLTIRFINEKFVEEYDPTLEDSYRKQVTVDDKEYLLDIFDTAGQEDFSAVRDQYMRTGDGFICVYAITLPHSFSKIKDFYDHVRRVKDIESIPLVVLGNKCDLESERKVSTEEGQALCQDLHAKFLETSAKTAVNVDEAFHTIVREMNEYRAQHAPLKDKAGKKGMCGIL